MALIFLLWVCEGVADCSEYANAISSDDAGVWLLDAT